MKFSVTRPSDGCAPDECRHDQAVAQLTQRLVAGGRITDLVLGKTKVTITLDNGKVLIVEMGGEESPRLADGHRVYFILGVERVAR